MYIILILFFASLIGIVAMIGRKLLLLQNQQIIIEEKNLIQLPDLREVRYVIIRKTREYGYITLVEIIRFSIRSSKLLKRKYGEAKNIIKNIKRKYNPQKKEESIKKEVSGFLKMISEYKQKVRKIKDKIKEEEKEKL